MHFTPLLTALFAAGAVAAPAKDLAVRQLGGPTSNELEEEAVHCENPYDDGYTSDALEKRRG